MVSPIDRLATNAFYPPPHPDRCVRAVVEQIREAEMVQPIDRLRLIHSPRKKTVIILCNIPLDIPVDELVTWGDLVGDGRLSKALTLCEENGWDALPLAGKEIDPPIPGAMANQEGRGGLGQEGPAKGL